MSSNVFRVTGILATFVLTLGIGSSVSAGQPDRIAMESSAAGHLLLAGGEGPNAVVNGEGPNVVAG
jgi:hypothetical protein